MRLFVTVGVVLCVFGLAGCALPPAAQTAPVQSQMQPLESRRHVTGDVHEFVDDEGRRGASTARVLEDGLVRVSTTLEGFDKPCVTRVYANTFAPPLEFRNCGTSSGTYTTKRIGDSIFPLSEGRSEAWRYSVSANTGYAADGTRSCEVKTTVNITVPAGTFDAYHVVCDDNLFLHEWYLDQRGVLLQFTRTNKRGALDSRIDRKLVSFTPGTT